jgi:hypothetical protein
MTAATPKRTRTKDEALPETVKRREYHRAWHLANQERRKAAMVAWYAQNKDVEAPKRRQWKKENSATVRAANAKWYEVNRDHALARGAAYQAANPDKVREKNRRCYRKNPGVAVARVRRYQAAKINACPPWAEHEIIELIYAEAAHRGMEVDHIIPLRGKMVCGLHIHTNMQLLTKSANCRKSNKLI